MYEKQKRPIIYLDESGFGGDNFRSRGYSLKGTKCFGTYDWGKKQRTNVIGALLEKEIIAPMLFETTINTEIFCTWMYQCLLPIIPANSIIVMDNAQFHKNKKMQEIIKEAGHTLEYLPVYSPHLNPIEPRWAHLKSIRRKNDCSIDSLFS